MKRGLLIMSYGTPERIEDVAEYYTHIRRGNPPPEALLEELIERYRAVGGPTALNQITRAQAEAIGEAVSRQTPLHGLYVAFKHVSPFIAEVVERMSAEGIERGVGLVLAPHYSLRSIAEYQAYAERANAPGLSLDIVPSWHDAPGFIEGLGRRLRDALDEAGDEAHVVFTAHSVPAAVLESGDPYPDQLLRTCELVAERTDVRDWSFAYQSAGRTADPWLGPDILDTIRDLADRRAAPAIVVQAIGFVSDHLEILYDLDLEARQEAERANLRFVRTRMQNADPDFVETLAKIVIDRLDTPPAIGEASAPR